MKCRDRHLWALALCGLRRGEIAGLRWANVDLNPKTVTVSENRMTVGKEIMTGTPKSKASTRTLPMPNEVAEGHASSFNDMFLWCPLRHGVRCSIPTALSNSAGFQRSKNAVRCWCSSQPSTK